MIITYLFKNKDFTEYNKEIMKFIALIAVHNACYTRLLYFSTANTVNSTAKPHRYKTMFDRSSKFAPFSIILRTAMMKYVIGRECERAFAQSGILSIEVNSPLSIMNSITKKLPRNIDCCCVFAKVEINKPIDRITTIYIFASKYNVLIFPRIGIP